MRVLPFTSLAVSGAAMATPLRIVCYNIGADISNSTNVGGTMVNDTEMNTVLQGIGNYAPAGFARPVDILALEETTSNSVTVQPIANGLNTLYGTTSYTVPIFQPTQDGSAGDGNGPNAIIYNSATLQLLGTEGVGTPEGSSNGEYRQVARYEFEPVNGTTSSIFYVYVCHAKSGSTSADLTDRAEEATIIRNDEATLPSTARVLYMGDLNIGASTEQSIVNLEASGQGQAFDPINMPGNYSKNSSFQGILTESAIDLEYRDDLQLITSNVQSSSSGLQYLPGSYTAFGNNGTTPIYGNVSNSSNTALAGLPNRSNVLTALTEVTDHLPVVADYNDVTAASTAQWNISSGGSWNVPADWSTGAIPDGQASVANFLSSPTGINAAATITLDGNQTVGKITFNNPQGYTISPGAGGILTIDDTGDSTVNPLINVVAGSHTISAALSLANGVTISSASGSGLTLSNSVTGAGTVTVSGAGTLTVASAGSISLPLNVTGNLTFAVNNGSGYLARSLSTLTIGTGGLVTVDSPSSITNRSVLITTGLTIAGSINNWAGKLNLGSNDMIVNNGTLTTITNEIKQAFANGSWSGDGISSSAAATNTAHTTTLGVLLNNNGMGQTIFNSSNEFDGQSPLVTDVLVKYTYFGDANLDGVVDGSDYTLIDNGYHNKLTGWGNGDFNYDGVVDGSDYTLIDNAYNQDYASPAAAIASVATQIAPQGASVPEPSMCAVVIIAGSLMSRRRRGGVTPPMIDGPRCMGGGDPAPTSNIPGIFQ